jgi:hypothetical protein
MPIFNVPPVRIGGWPKDREHGCNHEHGQIHEFVRERVGSRNYRRMSRWGEGHSPKVTPSHGPGLWARLRKLLRRNDDNE